jgi:hypothetical protein
MTVPTDALLRTLDAAAPGLSESERRRADATLDRIVATPLRPVASRAAGHRRLRRRLVLLPALAIALAAVAMLTQGGGGDRVSFSSWSPTPSAVVGRELSVAQSACRNSLRGSSLDLDRARLVLAERRGDFVALLYRTEVPDLSGSCLMQLPTGATRAHWIDGAVGGSSGPALAAPDGGFTQGAVSSSAGVSITDGAVGAGVRAVTIHADRISVHATIRDGRYAAWWPGPAYRQGPSGPKLDLTYDLTLDNGTVVTNAQPTRPR